MNFSEKSKRNTVNYSAYAILLIFLALYFAIPVYSNSFYPIKEIIGWKLFHIHYQQILNSIKKPHQTWFGFITLGIIMIYSKKLIYFIRGSKYEVIGKIDKKSFHLKLADFTHSGIICGAIGSGKTTLRLHLQRFLLSNNIRIIDFDIKGDSPRFSVLSKNSVTLIPKINFSMNLFECPKGMAKKEYAEILLRSFLELLPDIEEVTPPQKNLLIKATYLTIQKEGNVRDFFESILMLGYLEREIVENNQELSAYALVSKLSWMQTMIGEILWKGENTLTIEEWENASLFFDFSILSQNAPIYLVRFLIDLIMSKILMNFKYEGNFHDNNKPQLVIFIDEAQLLMPKRKDLRFSKLEETVTTLRYKGVSLFASGVSADQMSPVLLDTGFIAQFRSSSQNLVKSLGLFLNNKNVITRLSPYFCILSSHSTGKKPCILITSSFKHKQESKKMYLDRYSKLSIAQIPMLDNFIINTNTIWKLKLLSVQPQLHQIQAILHNDISAKVSKFLNIFWVEAWNLKNEFILLEILSYLNERFNYWTDTPDFFYLKHFSQEFMMIAIQELLYRIIVENLYNKTSTHIKNNYKQILQNANLIIDHLVNTNYQELEILEKVKVD